MEEVVANSNGEPNNGRATLVELAEAKAIREGLGMSQAVSSRAYGIPLKTLQHWEQRRHNPDRTAFAYLWTIEEYPGSSPRSTTASPDPAAGSPPYHRYGVKNRRNRP